MPYACSYEVPADEQLYQRVNHEIGSDAPEGMLVHLVLRSDRGLRHIGVWETQGDWERFRDQRVRPAVLRVLQAAGVTERPPRPEEEELDVVDLAMTGR
ncbi:MAG: hypothetical protein QOG43_533 [Actinomycetota bacterium]|jgi:hypothetical protein|nr:hypothetical protein [Actinomycetota bacterium]